MQMSHRELFSRTFRINEGQNLPEAQLVSQVLLERLATGAHRHKTSEIGHCLPTGATRHRSHPVLSHLSKISYCITASFGGDGELWCLCGKAGTSHLCDGSAHSSGCVVNGSNAMPAF